MSHDPHLGFVAAAYIVAFVVVAGMTAALLLDHMRLKRSLASLAARAGGRSADGQQLDHQDVGTLPPESFD